MSRVTSAPPNCMMTEHAAHLTRLRALTRVAVGRLVDSGIKTWNTIAHARSRPQLAERRAGFSIAGENRGNDAGP